jgi:uncharacterized protein YndB with AHSA1/START domain
MTDEHDALEVAAEVAGTPERVWEMIATGPGISAWFMPAEVDGRAGGTISQRHAPGDEGVSHGRITAFEPPRRLVYEESPGDATLATEFLVEARSGGTCVVRVVTHGIGAFPDDFAGGVLDGWMQALATLRIRLESFADAPFAFRRVWAARDASLGDAWAALAAELALDRARPGDAVERRDGPHPPFAGVVEVVRAHGLVVRTTAPHHGVLRLAGTGFGGRTSLVVDRYVYERGAEAAADADAGAWTAYLAAVAPASR